MKKRKQFILIIVLFIILLFECGMIINGQKDKTFVLNITSAEPSVGIIESQDVQLNTKININTATKQELMELPGIGEVISGRIIEYRTKYGRFKNTNQIKKVKGIGDKTYSDIKELIIVD